MKSFGTRVSLLVSGSAFRCLIASLLLALGHVACGTAVYAQETWTVEFTDAGAPTFRSEPQPVTVQEAMGALLATTESFRLLADFTDSRLARCASTRPDLPDARIQPTEIADRVGSLNLALFEGGQVNFTFRTTTNGTEYAITMNASGPDAVEVVRSDSGELVLSATGAPLSVVRDQVEMFSCTGVADFTIRWTP